MMNAAESTLHLLTDPSTVPPRWRYLRPDPAMLAKADASISPR